VGTEPDPDCEGCDGTGHREDCEARQPAWDIADLFMRRACDGCCPNGHKPHGLQAMQDRATTRAQSMIGTRRRR